MSPSELQHERSRIASCRWAEKVGKAYSAPCRDVASIRALSGFNTSLHANRALPGSSVGATPCLLIVRSETDYGRPRSCFPLSQIIYPA